MRDCVVALTLLQFRPAAVECAATPVRLIQSVCHADTLQYKSSTGHTSPRQNCLCYNVAVGATTRSGAECLAFGFTCRGSMALALGHLWEAV